MCLAVALGLGGCAGPATHAAVRHAQAPVGRAQADREYPSPPAPVQTAADAAPSAGAAVAAFALAYINWNTHTVGRDMRRLAARSIGQARAAMQLAATQVGSDYELQRGGIGNRGAIEAIAPLRQGHNRYVVVTRELTTATATTAYEGLRPAWHVAIATVARAGGGGWVVSGWQPQS